MPDTSSTKLYVIAGEASGDLHGANLLKELLKQNEKSAENHRFEFRFWGGDKMIKALKISPRKHFHQLAFMGFWEVISNLQTILKNFKFCKKDIADFQPDILLLIDYPGFNLRIAKWAHRKGIKVYYYISPTVWAWKESRVHTIKKAVDRMYVILPFEKPFYKKFNYEVEYYGHPLLDALSNFRQTPFDTDRFRFENGLTKEPIIAVLPGSRKQEIRKKLPVMLEAADSLSNYQIVIAAAPGIEAYFYGEFITSSSIKIVFNETYEILSIAEAALVTSGTATLETALLNVPQVVCYKTSRISYAIAKRLVKIKYISLVNLILDRKVVTELIQKDCTVKNIRKELANILENGKNREEILQEYKELKTILGEGGASQKIAQSMLKTIQH
jgi:lipid-A-disaccharide synthase